MPCRDDYPESYEVRLPDNRLDIVTRIACTALRFIETNGLLVAFADKESLEWWEEHKEADEKRLKAKQDYLAKTQELTQKLNVAISLESKAGVAQVLKELNTLLDKGYY